MAVSRSGKAGLLLLSVLLGAVIGGGAGLLAGLAYTELAATSGFEGYSGFVVAYWLVAGIILGMIAGPVIAARRLRT